MGRKRDIVVEGRAVIVDAAHTGEPGELWLRGPTVIRRLLPPLWLAVEWI